MNIVNAPLGFAGNTLPRSANRIVYTMQAGQLTMALLLTLFGAARAIKTGVSLHIVATLAAALIVWQLVGFVFPASKLGAAGKTVWLAVFFALWITAVTFSPEFVWVAFLLWLLAGHLLPVLWGIVFSALTFTVVAVAPVLHNGETTYANIFGPLIGAIFAFGISRGYLQLLRDFAQREVLLKNLKAANERAEKLQLQVALAERHTGAVQERTRIARDIHDTVAQSLSSIRLLAHAKLSEEESETEASEATKDSAGRAETLNRLQQLENIAGEALSDVRRIIAALAPSELESGNLKTALIHLVGRLEDETGIKTRIHFDDMSDGLDEETEIVLLRAAQSALANVREHSEASLVAVTLTDAGNEIRLDIIDDGKGFEKAKVDENDDSLPASFGLRFMRDRLTEAGGGIEVDSSPGKGTSISMHLPKGKTIK